MGHPLSFENKSNSNLPRSFQFVDNEAQPLQGIDTQLLELAGIGTDQSTNSDKDVDSTNASIPSDPVVLPGKIANALVLVYEGFNEFDLFENHRKVLACLIRYGVNLNHPEADIFVKKSTIARRLGINEATVYRSLTALAAAGLIERDPQTKLGQRYKTIAYIRLSTLALRRLGLARHPEAANAAGEGCDAATGKSIGVKPPIADSVLAPVQDVNNAPKQSSLKNQPARGFFEKIGNRKVPSDLAWLHVENSLSLSGLFKLMKAAKGKGTRLSDIVTHSKDAVSAIRGRDLYAYLTNLIGLPIDHAYKAKQREALAQAAQSRAEETAKRDRLQREISSLVGCSYESPDGRCWTVDQHGFVVSGNDRDSSGSVPFTMALSAVEHITSGKWPLMSAAGTVPQHRPVLPEARTSARARDGVASLRTVLANSARSALERVDSAAQHLKFT
ncbi:MAG: helix-turn-helix domain-containing protein [Burkholderiales bacterium]|nr:helix-turn-helix domain-containing protein [Burkholderiales bacterium]